MSPGGFTPLKRNMLMPLMSQPEQTPALKGLTVLTVLMIAALGFPGLSMAQVHSPSPDGPESVMPHRGQLPGQNPRPAFPAKPSVSPQGTKAYETDSPIRFPAQRGDIIPKACIPSTIPLVDKKLHLWWGKTPLPSVDEPVKRA